jgi:hypothetical protein
MLRRTLLLVAALGLATTARADVVTIWNSAALDAIRADRTSPPIASRALAMLHVSIYDAVNGISRTHEPYFVRGEVPASASEGAAASAAAHDVLVTLFAAHAASFDALNASVLRATPESRARRIHPRPCLCSFAVRSQCLSRLYGGIHYRSANEDGLSSGLAIGEWTFTHVMQPKQNRSRH